MAKQAPKAATKPAASKKSPMAKKLLEMKEAFDNKKSEAKKSGGGTTLEPGIHITRLTDAKLIENDRGIAVVFEFTEVEGEQVGEKAVLWHNLSDEDRLVWFQRDLIRLGFDLDEIDITQIEEILEQLKKDSPGVKIQVKENGEYTNVNIKNLVDTDGMAETAAEDTADETEPAAEEEPAADEGEPEPEVEEDPAEEVEPEPEPEEEAEEAYTPEVKDSVQFVLKGAKVVGKVVKVDLEAEKATVEYKGTKYGIVFAKLEKMVKTK